MTRTTVLRGIISKRNGEVVADVTRSLPQLDDVVRSIYWGQGSAYKVKCEGHPGKLIGWGPGEGEAGEVAAEQGAQWHEDAGWFCEECIQVAAHEAMADFEIMRVEANLREMERDAHESGWQTAYLRAKGEL